MIIGKYYPNFFTQFLVGCVFYTIAFFILIDIIPEKIYNEYKYYMVTLISADLSFLVYKAKFTESPQKEEDEKNIIDNTDENTTERWNNYTNSATTIDISSDINDFRITHDISSSEANNDDLFSSGCKNIFSNSINNSDSISMNNNSKSISLNDNFDSISTNKKSDTYIKSPKRKLQRTKEPSAASYHSDTINSEQMLPSITVTTVSL